MLIGQANAKKCIVSARRDKRLRPSQTTRQTSVRGLAYRIPCHIDDGLTVLNHCSDGPPFAMSCQTPLAF
jgi:hypothetical protein